MLKKNKKLSFFPFKKVSLTFKITLWYTTFIVLLIGSLIIGTFFVSDSVVESGAKKRLIEEVTEISSGADTFTPFEDGVTLSVYDKDGNLVAGSVPRNFFSLLFSTTLSLTKNVPTISDPINKTINVVYHKVILKVNDTFLNGNIDNFLFLFNKVS